MNDKQKENEIKKEYLMQYISCQKAAKRIEEQIYTLETERKNPKGLVITDMPTSHKKTDLSDYIVKRDELFERMRTERYKAICAYMDIFTRIELLEDETEKQVLTLRYIKGHKNWEKIAKEIDYSVVHTHRFHSKALEHFKI